MAYFLTFLGILILLYAYRRLKLQFSIYKASREVNDGTAQRIMDPVASVLNQEFFNGKGLIEEVSGLEYLIAGGKHGFFSLTFGSGNLEVNWFHFQERNMQRTKRHNNLSKLNEEQISKLCRDIVNDFRPFVTAI